MTHALKTWPEFFKVIVNGEKTFEIRKNDRKFKVGDKLLLQEWKPNISGQGGDYTGQEEWATVVYILDHAHLFGVCEGYILMGIKLIDSPL